MGHPSTITVAGKRWRLLFERLRDCNGSCDDPATSGKAIRIHAPLLRRPQALLDTVVHEVLHASGWPLSEEFVTQAADDIARTLWRLGFRHAPDGE